MPVHARHAAEHRNSSPLAPAIAQTLEFRAEQVPAGTALSFETLFRTYHLRLCAFARGYVKCPEVAEELVEDVFLRLWERGSWPSPNHQKRYLYAAVRNRALKHLAHERVVRKSQAMAQQQGYAPGMSQAPAAPDEEVQAMELATAFEDAIDQLPDRCREAYTLHRQHGLSYAAVARIMGTSVRTVETQIARAHKAFRQQLAAWLP